MKILIRCLSTVSRIVSMGCLLALVSVLAYAGEQPPNAEQNQTGNVESRSTSLKKIEPPDVFVHVALLRDELELIRHEIGHPKNKQPAVKVIHGSPRGAISQSRTLFRKANQLCFEQVREVGQIPRIPSTETASAQAYAVVDATLERVRRVKAKLGITKQSVEIARDARKTSIDVFISMVQANRQLNLLLDRQFTPSEAYEQVTAAIYYASRLLSRYPNATRIPKTPPLERGKRPRDVHRRLRKCLKHLQKIHQHWELKMIELQDVNDDRENEMITPNDVHDTASLLISELVYVLVQTGGKSTPMTSYYPGRKFPSHVYQRVGILEAQLIEIQKQIEQNPDLVRGVKGSR